jgi:hypothetical protein
MPFEPTRVSRYSFGYVSSTQSITDKDPSDTYRDFSCINGASTGSFYVAGALGYGGTLSGATGTFSAGIGVGGGTTLQVISTGTAAVSLGAINPLESSSVQTFAVSGLSRGDFLAITVDSIYPNAAANRDITWMCSSSSTAGEGHVWGVNSTLTAVTPTASTFIRWVRIKAGNYPAA